MEDYCRTGVNAIIMPGKKIGSYSVVGPGVIFLKISYEDVPSKTIVLTKQELIKRPWSPIDTVGRWLLRKGGPKHASACAGIEGRPHDRQ